MSIIKLRLEVETGNSRKHLRDVEVPAMPRVGDKMDAGGEKALEVIEVVHTPFIRDWDAVVVLRALKGVVVIALPLV